MVRVGKWFDLTTMSKFHSILAGINKPSGAPPSGIEEVGAGSQRAQVATTSAVATQDFVYPGSVTSGDLLVIAGGMYAGDGNPTFDSLTSTRSSAFSVFLGSTVAAGLQRTFIAYALATSSGACTITADLGSDGADAAYISAAIDEFSGVNATPLDVDGGTSTGTSTSAADTITTLTANDLIIGVATHVTLATLTATGGLTTFGEYDGPGTDQVYFNAAFQIATSATAYSPTWTLGSLSGWAAQTAAFKPA